ncbi:Bug family tripartite tricarboxylate transporter substrate binding protein [Roseomonas sp. CCTCC AB2023176]|uniref:Bug family tripartite tricarboxylate transporter substrate binding protein n=1 Tax=Roseomonas sp. CCTCC AB2023176 TaxID=3342640 RepID=UPI0035D53BD6
MQRRPLIAAAGATLAMPALAQSPYPNRPIRFVIPWAPGGATANIARIIGDEMAKHLGQPLAYDHRPGAGGALGSDNVAKSPPDGYSILIAGAGTFYRPLVERDTPFNPDRDFGFVGLVGDGPFVLVTSAALPSTDLPSFIAHAKANPGKLNFASSGQGSTSHLAGEMFNTTAGIQGVHVPYRGAAPAMTDLVAGRVDYFFDALSTVLENVRAARIRAVGVTTAGRVAEAPDIPTLSEAGLPGFVAAPWWGLVCPAGVPTPAIARLSEALRLALEVPQVVSALGQQGCRAVSMAPGPFEAYVREENAKWSRVIDAAGLRVG